MHSDTQHCVEPTTRQRFYYPELDSIRLLLFLGVWSYHALPREEAYYVARHVPAGFATFITGAIRAGMCSLDVFFVLSAFLITELLLREREQYATADLKTFYVRRLLRIWPLYFFTIGLAGLVSIWDRSQPLTLSYAAAFLMFAGNWIIILRGSPGASMLNPLWSVSFEEQFYLLWPLILRRASKAQVIKIAIGLLFLANLSRLILLLNHAGARTLWINSFVRLDSIAGGILLAIFLHGRPVPRIPRDFRLTLFLLGGCIWLTVGRYCGLHEPEPPLLGGMIGYPLMALGAVIIFLSVFGASQEGVAFIKHPVLVYLGKISYGLYAFHILALRCAYYLFRNYHHAFQMTLSGIASLGITFLMATVSFRWLESPFLRMKQNRFTHVPSGPLLDAGEEAASPSPSQVSVRSPETQEGCGSIPARDSSAGEPSSVLLPVSQTLASSIES
jgi:peptidoglycan/LPS O-acetylase OafA/YrhL